MFCWQQDCQKVTGSQSLIAIPISGRIYGFAYVQTPSDALCKLILPYRMCPPQAIGGTIQQDSEDLGLRLHSGPVTALDISRDTHEVQDGNLHHLKIAVNCRTRSLQNVRATCQLHHDKD